MNPERIATLLASGLPHTSVATIVGLSPARISQLLQEEDFKLILAAKQAEAQKKDIEELSISAKYLEAEHILIKQVIEMAPISELRDVTAALRVVGERQEKAKNRMNPIVSQQAVYNTVVQLSLPAHATPELNFAANREVIAIENRNLAPLSSSGVLSLFKGLDTPKQLTEEGTNHESLPAPSSSTESHSEALSIKQTLASAATKFLDSLHPAPFASTF
jgi:hypothetical protein